MSETSADSFSRLFGCFIQVLRSLDLLTIILTLWSFQGSVRFYAEHSNDNTSVFHCQGFFQTFFKKVFLIPRCQATAFIIYHSSQSLSTSFFIFFQLLVFVDFWAFNNRFIVSINFLPIIYIKAYGSHTTGPAFLPIIYIIFQINLISPQSFLYIPFSYAPATYCFFARTFPRIAKKVMILWKNALHNSAILLTISSFLVYNIYVHLVRNSLFNFLILFKEDLLWVKKFLSGRFCW